MSDAQQPNDQQLIELVKQGDSDAFGKLADRYQHALTAAASRVARHDETIEIFDLVQIALFKTWKAICNGHFDSGRPFGPYITTVISNEAVNHWRKQKHRIRSLEYATGHDEEEGNSRFEPVSREIGWLQQALNNGRIDRVNLVLNDLDNRQRSVLVRRYNDELSCEAIAAEIGLSVDQVYGLLHRARENFRRAWNELEKEERA